MSNNQVAPAVFASNDLIFLGEGLFETIHVAYGKPRYPALHWEFNQLN